MTRPWINKFAGVLGTLTCVAALVFAPSALATDFAWTGADSGASAPDWSNGDDWIDDASPASPIGTLAFPNIDELCPNVTADACFDSVDDIGPLTAQRITVDDNLSYLISPADPAIDAITLDPSSGYAVDAEPAVFELPGSAEINVPLVLATDQKWLVDGGGAYPDNEGLSVAQASGDHTLEVDLDQDGTFSANTLDTGSLTIAGDGTGVFDVAGTPATLPAAGVDVANAWIFEDSAPNTTAGPLTVHAGTREPMHFYVGGGAAPDATLAVNGQASFGAGTYLGFDIDDNGMTPSADYSQLTATGDIDFDSATIDLGQGKDSRGECAQLTVGNTYTLVSSEGVLSGTVSYLDSTSTEMSLAEGQTSRPIAIGVCGSGSRRFATLTYSATALTATIIGGNVPTFITVPTISGTPTVGSPLHATTGTWDGDPTSYHYAWQSCASGAACGTPIGTDSPEYTPANTDVGRSIEVCVSATNSYGTSGEYGYCSNYTSKITASPVASTSPPADLGTVTILGAPAVGRVIGAVDGGWAGSPTLSYQWERCGSTSALTCVEISGATSETYAPTGVDLGYYLSVTVTGTNAAGSTTKYATPVGPVTALPASPFGPITTSRPTAVPPPIAAQIRSTLEQIGHPSGKKTIAGLIKNRTFSTSFRAWSAGELRLAWTTIVTTGKGKHKKRKAVVIARGSWFTADARRLNLRIRLTGSGEKLLREKPSGVATTARETFDAPGPPPPVTVTKKFNL